MQTVAITVSMGDDAAAVQECGHLRILCMVT